MTTFATTSRPLVIDASVALKWVLNEPHRAEAALLLDAFENDEIDFLAPPFFLAEVGSSLARRYRRKEMDQEGCWNAFRFIQERRPSLSYTQGLFEQAFALSIEHQLSCWDASYLALAIEHRCDLVTADRRFYESARVHYPYMRMLGEPLL